MLKIQNMIHITKRAFTLVELIVVITILAVLATVGFISMTGYSRDSRDSIRLTDLKSITKAFEIQKTKDIKLTLPDKKVDISASGSVFQYQGLLSENILWSANVHGGGTDPQTGEYYGYVVNKAQNKFQVIWFLENWENITKNNNFNISQTYADNSNKFPKVFWDILWFFTTPLESKIIIQESWISQIDPINTQNEYRLILDQQQNNLVGTWVYLGSFYQDKINPIASCLAILKNGNSHWSWMYEIQPEWESITNVYCDMETHWGGWTRLFTWSWTTTNDTLIRDHNFANKVVTNEVMWYYPPTGDYNIFRSKNYYEFFSYKDSSYTWSSTMDLYTSLSQTYKTCKVSDGTSGTNDWVALYCNPDWNHNNILRNFWNDAYYFAYFDVWSENGFQIWNNSGHTTPGYEQKYYIYVR